MKKFFNLPSVNSTMIANGFKKKFVNNNLGEGSPPGVENPANRHLRRPSHTSTEIFEDLGIVREGPEGGESPICSQVELEEVDLEADIDSDSSDSEDKIQRCSMSPPLAHSRGESSKGEGSSKGMEGSPGPVARTAVAVKGAWKQYGSGSRTTPVLLNLNMTVLEGTIYSLLGASGCGKTTLLACSVGMRRLDRGDIFIFGHRPGTVESGVPGKKVGYMPQEIALYSEFTIREAMQYFGRIYGMSMAEIEEKMSFLIKFLDLPSSNRQINTLSGGQQRRVSFSLALLHDPEVLILDEPTVGVDPLLRQSIWNHLSSLVKTKKTTVIITTHYIEEAKQATTIGLMRGGRLLAEDSPANLLKSHQCISLEEVFLKLCMKDKTAKTLQIPSLPAIPGKKGSIIPVDASLNMVSVYNEKSGGKNVNNGNIPTSQEENSGVVGLTFHQSKENIVPSNSDSSSYASSEEQDLSLQPNEGQISRMDQIAEDCSDFCTTPTCTWNPNDSLNRLRAMIIKNFIVMWRNIGFMLFIFVLPAIQVILFCLAIGRAPMDMKVGVVNHEVPDMIICQGPEGCTSLNLSCRFLDTLPTDSVRLIPYKTEEEAIQDIHDGNLWALLSFPSNFSTYMVERGLAGNLADNDTIFGSRVRVQMDMSNQQIAFSLQRTFLESFRTFSRKLLADCEYDPDSGDIPLYFDTPIYGDDHPSFMEFMAPGIVLSIIFFMAVALTGSAFITEKKEGMLDRSMVAGVVTGEVITAHMITQYVVMMGQTALVLLFMMVVFEVPVRGPLFWAIVITLLQGTCGMAFGFLISTVCHEERNAIQLALGSFYPNLLLSGVVWPIESMPKLLRDIAYILPETLACESMRSILTRGWGITHPSVWPGFLSSIIWSIIFWILAVIVARFSRSK